MKHIYTILLAFFLPILAVAQTAEDSVYVFLQDQPDGGYFLPAPPKIATPLFANDYQRWLWGKSVRPTARGKKASVESAWKPAEMIRIMSEVLEMEISETKTPAIYRLIRKATITGDKSSHSAKVKYMRTRPFAQMNEHVWAEYDDEEILRHNGSYPSGHTSLGWAAALATAEMAPDKQDTILRRGFEFGENRVIVGAHWQSDVNAGYLCASASIARAHANPVFRQDMLAARAEYQKIKHLKKITTRGDYPQAEKILPEPIDTASEFFLDDMMHYWLGKDERETERGQQALRDADYSLTNLLRIFSEVTGKTLSEDKTPQIAALIDEGRRELLASASGTKYNTFRKRPFAQFSEQSLLPQKEKYYTQSSSFPSASAEIGWGVALLLTEIMPDLQNELLKRGFEYGRSCIITGYNYASDVQAARLLASCVIARLHTVPDFDKKLESARKEYMQIK